MLRRLFVHAVSTLRPSTLNRQGDGVSHTLARRAPRRLGAAVGDDSLRAAWRGALRAASLSFTVGPRRARPTSRAPRRRAADTPAKFNRRSTEAASDINCFVVVRTTRRHRVKPLLWEAASVRVGLSAAQPGDFDARELGVVGFEDERARHRGRAEVAL